MNPTSSATLDAHFRYRIDDDEVGIDSVSGNPQLLLGFGASAFLDGSVDLRACFHVDDEDIAVQLFAPQATASQQVVNLRLRQANGRIRCVRCTFAKSVAGASLTLDLLLEDAKSLPRTLDDVVTMASFRAMMENTDDFIFFKDRNHVLTGASQTLVVLCDPAEHWTDLLGQTDYDVFPEEFADAYYKLEKRVYTEGVVVHEVQEYLTKEGRQGWVDNRKYPIRNASGEIIGLYGIARDITEQRQAEEALRRKTEALQLILDFAPIGIWLQNGKGKLSVVNKAFCGAMGIPEERFLAVPHYAELIPEAFREQCIASDVKALASTGVSVNHQRLPFVDGKVHDLRVIKAVKRDVHGEPEFLVGLSLDITEEMQRDQALHVSEQRFRTLFESIPSIAVQGYDAERRVIFWNHASEVLYGFSRSEALGRKVEDLIIPEEMRQSVIEAINDWFAGGPAIPAAEVDLCHKDGTPKPVFSSHVMQQGPNGLELYCIDIDLSEQKRAERRLALALDAAKILIFELDFTTDKLGFDGCAMTGLGLNESDTPDTLAGWLARVHPDDRQRFIEMVERALPDGDTKGFDCEYRFDDRAGGYHWLHTVGRVVQRDALGRPLLGAGYSVNITDRKSAEEALRLAANVFTHAREGITITDRHARILDVNAAFTDITGFSREEVLGQNPRILSSGRQGKDFYDALWQDLQTQGHWTGEIWNRRKDGEVIAEMLTISAVRDERGETQNYIALFSDITTIKAHQTRLEHIAHYDALTGLPNRLLLGDRLRQAMSQAPRRGQRLAVAYLDLDGFKAVNDTHDHEVGDQLLTTLARLMTKVLRDGDTLGRLGGDEFVAVLVDLPDIDASAPILTRLLEVVAQPVTVSDIVLRVSASLGVTFYPQSEAVDADQLLRQADQAMYQAKQAGKNRYHIFDAEQDRHVRGRHESLEHIRQALGNQEFVLHYQPKVNMRTGELIGAEALIRWQHPRRGLLSPAAFLPVIEDQPLAIDLGEWVIDSVLTQIETWRATGLSIPVSVNVGALQLQHPDFVSRLRTLLARHPGVSAGELELEILETSALEDFAGVSQVMATCRELGIVFALDDFGTGYASLTYLKQLPVAVLKIDQSFVHDMLDDPDDLAILEGVLGLATAFRRQTIAEGVETLAHGEMLLRLGCEWAQGYAIARPMLAPDFRRWVGTWDSPPAWKALKPVSRDRLPMLFATVEHRAWVSAMDKYLAGKCDSPPDRDAHQCRFGHWLDHGGRASLLGEDADHPVDALHREIHRLAAELMALKQDGMGDEAHTRMTELHCLHDQLLEQMSELY